MAPRGLGRALVQIMLAFAVTTLLLMIYLNHSQSEKVQMELVEQKHKIEATEALRKDRLRKLQMTMFNHPTWQRPPDSKYNLNVSLSERTPLDRDVPDSRPASCKWIHYDRSILPTLTVIIPFYNEALSMLLRTVHSILKRTPPHLLQEIILVDDGSPNKDIKEPLDKYIKLLPKVKMIHTPKREGLIRARLIGANLATGDVLMFQDAHTENNVGWAEPLLEEIRKNPRTIIQPHVDAIDQWTLEYHGGSGSVPRGGFSWDLRMNWTASPQYGTSTKLGQAAIHMYQMVNHIFYIYSQSCMELVTYGICG